MLGLFNPSPRRYEVAQALLKKNVHLFTRGPNNLQEADMPAYKN